MKVSACIIIVILVFAVIGVIQYATALQDLEVFKLEVKDTLEARFEDSDKTVRQAIEDSAVLYTAGNPVEIALERKSSDKPQGPIEELTTAARLFVNARSITAGVRYERKVLLFSVPFDFSVTVARTKREHPHKSLIEQAIGK